MRAQPASALVFSGRAGIGRHEGGEKQEDDDGWQHGLVWLDHLETTHGRLFPVKENTQTP